MWPLAGGMEHAEDFDNIIAHAVGDQVRGIGDNQLASALDASRAAQAGMLSKQFDGPRDRVDHAGSGGGIIEGDEGRLVIKRRVSLLRNSAAFHLAAVAEDLSHGIK